MQSRFPVLVSLLAATVLCFFSSNTTAQVKSQAKISDATTGFAGVLGFEERFGIGVTSLGDLDGDGVTDLAAGAYFDGYEYGTDGNAYYKGGVYVLFMNADGSVKSHVRIAEGAGGFGGTLDYYDEFGVSVAAIGDLDDDGVVDLAIGARLDDDAANGANMGYNRGAIWVVFLNANGTVKSQQKISAWTGGFTGGLDDNDWFGAFVTALGDLDGDGVEDLAAGTPFDDDGGEDTGAIWILFLNSNGTVKAQQKISALAGNFTAALDPGDRFGTGPGNITDIDGDGVIDLATGAIRDDDGATDLGAVYILHMNSNGTVKSHAKISATSGGFAGPLPISDFGSMCVLAQPGNVVQRIAVSAKTDDDGGYRRGAVWLLDIMPDGSVTGSAKISSLQGDFAGPLHDGDEFGLGLASLGDFDNDGNWDIAVGARLDDDGPGANLGAVWLLFLGTCNLVTEPSTIDFGSVTAGSSADAQFVLRNDGFGTATGSIEESCSAFSIVSGGGPFSLASGDSLAVTVRFTPPYAGTFHCTIQSGAACGQVSLNGAGADLPPEPGILSIRDIPNDEGRRVRITFARSGYDRPYSYGYLEQYEIYRRIDVAAATPVDGRGIRLEDWDYVTAVPVHGENEYNVVVGTLEDSTVTSGMHWSVFMVRAATYDPYTFYDSDPDSGYSLDNTPPPPPATFAVDYTAADGNLLSWARSNARDLLGYRVFRGLCSSCPDAREAIAMTRDTRWTDSEKGNRFRYWIAAVDSAGNESPAVAPQTETGRDGPIPQRLTLHQNEPNPFNPITSIRYEVPSPGGRVTLNIYDVHGRLVRTLLDRNEPAGSKSTTWDGRNNAGSRVASGTYFYRLESNGEVLTRKMTLLE